MPPLLRQLKALNWAGEVSGKRRWRIGVVSPQNLWLDLAEVRFPLFSKWARPGFSAEAIKSHFAPPSIPRYKKSDGVLDGRRKETECLLPFPVHVSGRVASQPSDLAEAWMSLGCCPERCRTEAGLIKCLIQLQSHYKRMWPATFIGGVSSCRVKLYCSDLIN